MQREWFIFYSSFLRAIDYLPKENQLKAYQFIVKYGLNGIDPPQDEDPIAYAIFMMAKPQLDANNKRFVNWAKWWAPQGNSNAKKDWENISKQPKTTEKQPKDNQKQPKEKEKDKVKDNVKEKEKVKDNSSNEELKNKNNNKKNKKINYSSEFELFRKTYPRKKGKQKAREAWENAINWGNDPELLIKKAGEYATEVKLKKTEEGYIKRPQGWLNEGRRDDEYDTWKTYSWVLDADNTY